MRRANLVALAGAIFLLGASSGAYGGIITSPDDPALAGATVETFDTAALGNYTTLALDAVTLTASDAPFEILDGSTGQYAPPTTLGDRHVILRPGSDSTTDALTVLFDAPVSAFGMVVGATNYEQTLTAYDSSGTVVGTLTLPDQFATLDYPYAGFYGLFSPTANISRFTLTNTDDDFAMDDLHYAVNVAPIPEPTSLVIFGLGAALATLAGTRRRRS